MPYSMLVHKATREALGVAELLRGAVVVIDEAHNLLSAVANAHSCSISLRNVADAEAQLKRYQDKYKSRLSPPNLRQIKVLRVTLRAILRFLARSAPTRMSAPAAAGAAPVARGKRGGGEGAAGGTGVVKGGDAAGGKGDSTTMDDACAALALPASARGRRGIQPYY